ncbi:MAG TPA: hypothetical protein VMT89_10265, partial [Candidatus Acidoferrales bacterium]|nr:hypothetical protein [Candidatus Acidoferrales bacterium]
AAGRMREDFYYRINVVPVHLPPLRQRSADIPLLAAEFLRSNALACEKGIDSISKEALAQLLAYQWPGNVRELLNVLERAILRAKGGVIREVDLPGGPQRSQRVTEQADYNAPLRQYLQAAERKYLARILEHYTGSIAPAARHAHIDQATLHRKLRSHGIRAGEFRRNGRGSSGDQS